MAFPPVPVFPKAIDSDYTLFLVHNTTETKLAADNMPWSQEIEIIPVVATKPEIWADNGFANIEGELLYYDSVEKDVNGKVKKLKNCARNLGGEQTKFNARGTWIRSFVVAEHHNQLVEAILKTEDFIGHNFDTRQKTLDWRIRNLDDLEVIFDDFSCPDVNFTFNIVEDDSVTGKLAEFLVEITPPGTINSYRLDFGDGTFTTTELEGTHRYPVNAIVDPVVTVSNDKCQIIQTPIERANPQEPPAQVQEVFDFPVPEIPDFPDFTFVPCDVPEPDINLPPLVVPCVSLEGAITSITGPDITLVSHVTITGPDEPVQILHSTVEIIGGPIIIPSVVLIDPPVPPTIIIDPPIPPTIVIVPPQSSIALALDITDIPRLEVDWGRPPEMEVALTLAKEVRSPKMFTADPKVVNEFGEEFADLFDAADKLKVEYESVGIPSEIRIIAPDLPKVEIETDSLQNLKLGIDASDVKIPTDIFVHGPESPIPDSIKLDGSEVPDAIDLVYRGTAIPVKVETEISLKVEPTSYIPERIVLDVPNPIPEKIVLEAKFPEKITLDAPESIPLSIPKDLGIPVIFPDKMPEIELVYRGGEIPIKIVMDEITDKHADGRQCVTIVPCTTH